MLEYYVDSIYGQKNWVSEIREKPGESIKDIFIVHGFNKINPNKETGKRIINANTNFDKTLKIIIHIFPGRYDLTNYHIPGNVEFICFGSTEIIVSSLPNKRFKNVDFIVEK